MKSRIKKKLVAFSGGFRYTPRGLSRRGATLHGFSMEQETMFDNIWWILIALVAVFMFMGTDLTALFGA